MRDGEHHHDRGDDPVDDREQDEVDQPGEETHQQVGRLAGVARAVGRETHAGGFGAPDALVDLSAPLWEAAAFTAVLLGGSDIPDLTLPAPREAVRFLSAVPITPTEAAWVRLKGAEAMRQAWLDDGVDVSDPNRRAARAALERLEALP